MNITQNKSTILDKFSVKELSPDRCFLCSEIFPSEEMTVEHIFPKWLQEKYNLWNQTLTLLNGSKIQYRYLTVPCCKTCNGKYLSTIENKVKKALENGFLDFEKLDSKVLYIWLGKIFYAILYKELFLLKDRKYPDEGSIISKELISKYKFHLFLLQFVRGEIEFNDFLPASIFIVKTQTPTKIEMQWDFHDSLELLFISMRIGEVGIVANLQDGGSQSLLRDRLKDFFSLPLHPLQFKELTAKVAYKSYLFNRNPKFMVMESENQKLVSMLPLQGFSDKPIFDEWDQSDYAYFLSYYTKYPLGIINPKGDDKVGTWIRDDDDNLNFIDITLDYE
jgi:hypothetical protein